MYLYFYIVLNLSPFHFHSFLLSLCQFSMYFISFHFISLLKRLPEMCTTFNGTGVFCCHLISFLHYHCHYFYGNALFVLHFELFFLCFFPLVRLYTALTLPLSNSIFSHTRPMLFWCVLIFPFCIIGCLLTCSLPRIHFIFDFISYQCHIGHTYTQHKLQ